MPEAWVERVLAREPRVAVFDCDGTLWAPDSGAGFMRWSLEEGLVPLPAADRLRERYRQYESGRVSEELICGEMVQVYAGLVERELRAAAGEYVERLVWPEVFAEMDRLVGELRRARAEVWAVSSTWDFVVEAGVVARFGIPAERVLGARARVADGRITDELLAVPTGAGKVSALTDAGVEKPDAAFGNSVHDLAMLQMARRAFPVNASEALRVEAAARRWEVFDPAEGVAS